MSNPQDPILYQSAPNPDPGSGKAVASLVLGLIGIFAWCLPIVGLPVNIIGLVLGLNARKAGARGMATAGVVLSIIGLVFSVINAAVGAYLGATGRLFHH